MHKGHDDQSASEPSSVSSRADEASPSSSRKRDQEFYMEDGSCVLLVGDTLFNVHRSMLSKDSSSFCSMFSLPQGNKTLEGRSDDNPIVLTGDSPEEFRHFLWVLYALPPELELLTSPFFNLDHLIDVAHVANKYSFKSLETWALDAIQEYVNRKPSPILGTIPSPIKFFNFGTDHQPSSWPSSVSSQKETANQLTRLIRLAQLCQHERLMNTMVNLLRQLMSSSVHYAYLAMTLSDELGLRTLRGASYLEVMQKVTVVKKVDVVKTSPQASTASSSASISSLIQTQANTFSREGAVDPSGRLIITQAQQLRLLSGYYRLTSFWDNLRLSPPQLEHSQSCAATWHQQGCMQSWLEFWKEKTRSDAVMGLGVADVIGRMKLLEKDYERWGSATYMHADCRSNAKKTISDIIKKVEDALPDFFEEPGGCIED